MGYSVPRYPPKVDKDVEAKLYKRLELLPEEALYLIERGSMFCWKNESSEEPLSPDCIDDVLGTPMTVQQSYAEMIGKEGLTLEKYQVLYYALK